MTDLLSLADAAFKWIVAPVVGVLWVLWKRQQDHHTDIAVMKTQIIAQAAATAAAQASHDKRLDQIMTKLDSIEAALRK